MTERLGHDQARDAMTTPSTPSRGEAGLWAVRGAGFGFGLLLIVIAASVADAAMGVLVLIVVALLLAAAVDPIVLALRDRLGRSRVQIILLLYVLLAVLGIALVVLLAPAVASQVVMLSDRLPQMLDDARTWAASLQPDILGAILGQLIDTVDSALQRTGATTPQSETLVQAGLTAADAVLAVMGVVTMVFFWLISRAAFQRFALSMVSLERRGEIRTAWNQVERRLGHWLRGQLTLMLVVGSATTVAYTVIGLPDPLVLGVIAGLAEVIPLVGPAIGAVPALISAFVSGGPTLAAVVVVVYVIIQLVEGHVLVPMVMRNAVGVPPFLVIVSLLVGGAVGGIAGALLAVPVMAAIIVVLEHAQARRRAVHMEPLDLASEEDGKSRQGSGAST